MDVLKLTYQVLGQRLLPTYDSKILVDWAIKLLESGFDSESLEILAGLDNDDTEIREKYFWKATKELSINTDQQEIDLINFYVDNLVNEVISGSVTPKYGLQMMCYVAGITDYNERFIQFYMLEEELDSLNYTGQSETMNGLTIENADNCIVEEFKLYKKLQAGDYSEYYNKAVCNNCGKIMTPKLKSKIQFKRPFRYHVFVCEFCNSVDIYDFSTQIGKAKIIKMLEH
jgi:RNase P subunit RPR2